MSEFNSSTDHEDTVVVQEAKPKLKKPPLFKVVLLNDDFTPMDFVMLLVHKQGEGVCGVFSNDVAETKVEIVNNYSRENQHPLMCAMEEA